MQYCYNLFQVRYEAELEVKRRELEDKTRELEVRDRCDHVDNNLTALAIAQTMLTPEFECNILPQLNTELNEREIARKDDEMARKDREIARKDGEIETKGGEIAIKDQENLTLSGKIKQLEHNMEVMTIIIKWEGSKLHMN